MLDNENIQTEEQTEVAPNDKPNVEEVEVTKEAVADDLDSEFGLDDELSSDFEQEIEKMKEDSALSEDLSAYAKGFPDWDLLPPEEKKTRK